MKFKASKPKSGIAVNFDIALPNDRYQSMAILLVFKEVAQY
jgi:hypothetical protein